MGTHTKGPWSLGTEGDGAVGSVYCDNSMGSRIAIVYGPEQRYTVFSREEEEANARLIAAAPELLEALRLLHDNLETAWPHIANLGPMVQARAAIAKAKGEA